ncbi:hypothetical protein [Dietzia maris]|uniref:hypothetical protein n=1 Tax=Dietzia maris TaxID=37915 RepID=UPI0037C84647
MIPASGQYELVTPFETIQRKLSDAVLHNNSAIAVVYLDSTGYECNLHFDIVRIEFEEDGIALRRVHGFVAIESADVPTIDVTLALDHSTGEWKAHVEWLKI